MTALESPALSASAGPAVSVRAWHCLMLLMILAVAAGGRIYRLGAESFWVDELYSLEFSAGHGQADLYLPHDKVIQPPQHLADLREAPPPHRLWTTLGDDPHPPLYYLLLRFWRETFGSSDVACRSLSVAASLAAIALLFDVGRLLFSPGVALWACGLMAMSQVQIRYAQEARSYVTLAAFLLAAASAVVRIDRFGLNRSRGVALFLSLLAVVLTHYFGVAGCLAFGLYALIRLRGPTRTRVLAIMAAAAVVYCAAWLPFALDQLHGFAFRDTWLSDAGTLADRAVRCARRLAYAPIRFFADASRRPGPLPLVGAVLLLLPLLRLRRVPALLLPALWALAWMASLAASDLARSTRLLDFPRYLIGASPAIYLLTAGLLWDRRGWVRHAVPGALLLYCVISLPWTYDAPKAEFRRLGELAARSFGPDDLILYPVPDGPRAILPGLMCVAVEHYAPQVTTPYVIVTGPLSPDILDRARTAGQVWLVTSGDAPDIPSLLPGFRAAEGNLLLGIGMAFRLTRDATPPAKKL